MILQSVENGILELGCHADSAHALNIGMASNGLQASPWLPHHATGQCEARDGLHRGRAVQVMRHAHRPRKDNSLRLHILRCHIKNL